MAEGVKTEDEAQIARDAGVDMLQGYLIGRPRGELSEGRLPLAVNARHQARCWRDAAQSAPRSAQLTSDLSTPPPACASACLLQPCKMCASLFRSI